MFFLRGVCFLINLDSVPIDHPFVSAFSGFKVPLPGRGWLTASALLMLATVIGGEGTRTASDELWQPWSMQTMQDSLAGGTPVLVDVTADWCVTCKANKALVLERDPVAGALATAVAEGSLVLLRADWTRPDADIAAFLTSHGRYGIPFNMLLTPDGRADTVFAEILTSSAIIEALENAAQTAK